MLSISGGYDGHDRCKFFGSRANKSNQTNTQEMRVTSWHPHIQLRIKSMLPCIRYGNEHTLWCIVPNGIKCIKPIMWTFLHIIGTKNWWAHHTKWGILCQWNNEFCSCIGRRGGTQCTFRNFQDGIILQLTLENLWDPQPKMPVHCDNATAAGISNSAITIKRQGTKEMEMSFFGVGDKFTQEMYDLCWHPGQENLANYCHIYGAFDAIVGIKKMLLLCKCSINCCLLHVV